MITEDYCSYEVAKLLKEKGFDEGCNSYFISDNEIALISNRRDFNNHGVYLSATTLQMAMKWLREVHLLHVYAEYHSFFQECPKKLYYHWVPFVKPLPQCKCKRPLNNVFYEIDEYYNSYEEACESAIKYCLENLI